MFTLKLIILSQDCLLRILRTSDRNLGLLIGRALDHQRFFHDVTYEHHLRDSQDKLYQFKHRRYSDLVKALDLHASLEDGTKHEG